MAGTANTFRSRPPQLGQTVSGSSVIFWTMSKVWPQSRQVYSYVGMAWAKCTDGPNVGRAA